MVFAALISARAAAADPQPPPPEEPWSQAFEGAPPTLPTPDSPGEEGSLRNKRRAFALLGGPVARWPQDQPAGLGGFLRFRAEFSGDLDGSLSGEVEGLQTRSKPASLHMLLNAELGAEVLSDGVFQVPLLGRIGVGFGPVRLAVGGGYNIYGAKGPTERERMDFGGYFFVTAVLAAQFDDWELGVELRMVPLSADSEDSEPCERDENGECVGDTPTRAVALGLYYAWLF